MFLYVFWLRKGPSLKRVRNCWLMGGGGGGGGHPKYVQLRTEGWGVTLYMYVRTYTISFHVLAAFLSYSVLFYLWKFNLLLPLFKKDVLVRDGYFFLTRLSVAMK